MTRSASIKSSILAIRQSLLKILKNGGGDVAQCPLVAVSAANDAYADLSALEKLVDSKQIIVKDRVDLFTDEGDYLFSVCKGNDKRWRRVNLYHNAEGREAIGTFEIVQPDYINDTGMNI